MQAASDRRNRRDLKIRACVAGAAGFNDVSYMLFYLKAPGIAGGSKTKAEEMADRTARVDAGKGMLARAEIAMHENHLDQLLGLYQKAAEADPSSYEAAIGLAEYFGYQM